MGYIVSPGPLPEAYHDARRTPLPHRPLHLRTAQRVGGRLVRITRRGDKPVASYVKKGLINYRDTLRKVPANAPKKFKGVPLAEVIRTRQGSARVGHVVEGDSERRPHEPGARLLVAHQRGTSINKVSKAGSLRTTSAALGPKNRRIQRLRRFHRIKVFAQVRNLSVFRP